MAMLAEPKRKQKYGNDPRNTFWSNDESKFGFRMLETMGWKKGKGLGASESGRTEHVKIVHRTNTDVRGVGCSKSHADKWIAHQDDFSALLSSLNDSSGDSPEDNSTENSASADTLSLEEKSKSSRSRVHYHKFTRGKDLSSRSSHDLDCIFGKRKAQTSESNTPTTQSEANSDDDEASEARPSFKMEAGPANTSDGNKDGEKQTDSHGIKTITSSSSIQEYFAQKMAELQQLREKGAGSGSAADCGAGPGGQDSVDPEDRPDSEQGGVGGDESEEPAKNDRRKKKKKSKKRTSQEAEWSEEQADGGHDQESEAVDGEQAKGVSKKKKKKKGDTDLPQNLVDSNANSLVKEGVSCESVCTESSESEAKLFEVSFSEETILQSCSSTIEEDNSDGVNAKKKKKKKKKKSKEADVQNESLNNSILRRQSDAKRPSKSVSFNAGADEVYMIPGRRSRGSKCCTPIVPAEEKPSKKRKRQKDEEEKCSKKKKKSKAEAVEMAAEEEAAVEKKSSKKKKKKKVKGDSESSDDAAQAEVAKVDVAITGKGEDKPDSTLQDRAASQPPPPTAAPLASTPKAATAPVHSAKGKGTAGSAPKAKVRGSRPYWQNICEKFASANLDEVKGYGC